LCEKYDIRRHERKIRDNISETVEHVDSTSTELTEKESVLRRFLEKAAEDHKKNLEAEDQDVYLLGLRQYKEKLIVLES